MPGPTSLYLSEGPSSIASTRAAGKFGCRRRRGASGPGPPLPPATARRMLARHGLKKAHSPNLLGDSSVRVFPRPRRSRAAVAQSPVVDRRVPRPRPHRASARALQPQLPGRPGRRRDLGPVVVWTTRSSLCSSTLSRGPDSARPRDPEHGWEGFMCPGLATDLLNELLARL